MFYSWGFVPPPANGLPCPTIIRLNSTDFHLDDKDPAGFSPNKT